MKRNVKAGLASLATAAIIGLYGFVGDVNAAPKEYGVNDSQKYEQVYQQNLSDTSDTWKYGAGAGAAVLGVYLLCGLRKIRPTEKGLVERFGKYKRVSDQGLQ